jgi:hypothetical protein
MAAKTGPKLLDQIFSCFSGSCPVSVIAKRGYTRRIRIGLAALRLFLVYLLLLIACIAGSAQNLLPQSPASPAAPEI